MLVRVTGGREGVAEYLRNGIKAGRDYTRDQLDERVPLAGDLDLTDSIVHGMTNEGNRYLHVTLAFKEDSITPEMLREITEEFRAFVGTAYADDEFNFYAEAHLPRIKHYTNRATGEQVERKPHVHVVIPQKNLLSGEHLNPFGIGERSNDFLKAFQERINAAYGLASPDDHSRDTFNNESAMLSRYKGDEFSGTHRQLKEQIRDDVMRLGIESRDDFRRYLAERWETSTVNSKGRECYAIKPEGSSKRVRLTEAFFSAENIERNTAEKLAAQQRNAAAYVAAQEPRNVQELYREREAFWREFRAKEIKYLNSGRRGEWSRYKAMDQESRAAFLAEKQANFYAKHRQELNSDIGSIERRATHHIDANLRAASRHIESAGGVDRNAELARRKLNDRRVARAVRAIVRGRGDDQEAHSERRVERISDTAAGSHLAKLRDQQQSQSAMRGSMDEIKQRLDGERLLKHLSHTHGLDPEKYQVHRTEKGDRIQCGNKSYNVTDFCTKEMNLPFADAAPVLRECYTGQKRELGIEAKPRPREALWQDYTQRWRGEIRQEAKDVRAAQLKAHAQARRAITEQFRKERAALSADRTIRGVEKKAARSVLRVRQVEAQAALRKTHAAERAQLAEQYPARPTFNDYLQDQAQRGNVDALNELRRQSRQAVDDPSPLAVAIDGKRMGETQSLEQLSYRVSRNGDVTYYDRRGDVMKDEASRVQAFRTDDDTLATALRVAERKFYEPGQKGATTVALAGSDAQVRRAVEVAVRENINVKFADPKHEAMRRDLQEKFRAGREFIAEQQRASSRSGRDQDRKNQAERPLSTPENQRQGPQLDSEPKPDRGRENPGLGR